MKSNKQKLRLFLMTAWMPWITVFSWNAGFWLSTELLGGIFTWQIPARETWVATAIWAVLLLLAWALGTSYAWVSRTTQPTVHQ